MHWVYATSASSDVGYVGKSVGVIENCALTTLRDACAYLVTLTLSMLIKLASELRVVIVVEGPSWIILVVGGARHVYLSVVARGTAP